MKVDHVEVCFEERENTPGALQIFSVKSYDADEHEIQDYQEYVGQYYFEENENAKKELKQQLSKDLGVPKKRIYLNFDDMEYTETPWDD